MTDKEQQEDELLALSSIYDENVLTITKDEEEPGGQFLACLHLPENFTLKVPDQQNKNANGEPHLHSIKFLPPIALNFQFPSNYPSQIPPNFTLSCKWLNRKQLTTLCNRLDEIWKENEFSEILFMWTSFLQEETYEFLGLTSPLDLNIRRNSSLDQESSPLDSRAIQELASQSRLIPVILEYDKQEKQREFDKSVFLCNVCFMEKVGSQCIHFLDCSHPYCKECMKSYFTVQIQEGNVVELTCPNDKCESKAHPSQTSLETMMDVMFCPRPCCQCPVLMEKDSNLGTCPACCYTRKMLEKRYGKNTIQQAVEESYSNEWIQKFSKNCPGCGAHIQKIDGCNKMTCMKCRTYFCWLCNQILSKSNPYSHYNTKNADCFNRLFEGIDDDEFFLGPDDDDDEWFQRSSFRQN
ncbi:hypothetical protein KUTeg_024146 [Tegillarca granosa]|uniref:RBR-type E3 ubiquitin transferase n=1 Tax=Tegillarca granosa TaxID=220873 RepID=A0ABQ9E264_TEGGR|nr:hypothetical protein KUTeg_024146 [Tegillarca granosa]